jgi:hypothetical protein
MPTLDHIADYERFRFDENLLSLDEAVRKAQDLRRRDSSNFYRVEQRNEDAVAGFAVVEVPARSVYADFLARVAKMLVRRTRGVNR